MPPQPQRSSSQTSSASHSAAPSQPPREPWYRRRISWWAVAITALVFITAAAPINPIRNAATLAVVDEARLDLSPAYLSVAPLSNVLDTLTLLTIAQHVAILLSAIIIFALVRVLRGRNRPLVVRREIIVAAAFFAGIVLVYVFGALSPRPMAGIRLSDPSIIVVDFHAHTKYSHDGRPGWTDEDVRDWHRGAGYDAVYITDHATFEGAERGVASNPGQAGQETVILQGLEVVYRGEHVNILSAGRRYHGLTDATLKNMDDRALALASLLPATSPMIMETIPGNLDRVPADTANAPGVGAIEIVDGSPRGLAQGRRDRARIVHIADSLQLALVTGSDNHGWGRTAPGWTFLRLPGWRGMTPDSLSRRIEQVLHVHRIDATRTVERRVANATNVVEVVFAAPLVAWCMLAELSADERVMWLLWTWGVVLLVRGYRRYRLRPSATG